MQPSKQLGNLTVIAGAMCAGKTETLLTRLTAAHMAKKRVFAFRPAADTRTERKVLSCRSGQTWSPAYIVETLAQALDVALPELGNCVIGLDELHMFNAEEASSAIQALLAFNCDVIAAGLIYDWKHTEFETTARLLRAANYVVLMHAPCSVCRKSGAYNHKKDSTITARIQPGFDYEARCFACKDL